MTKQDLQIKTHDGTAKAGLFRSSKASAAKSGVILYQDAFGPRPALDGMAERLAAEGYAVLVPDLFHRNAPYGPFDAKTAFTEEKTKAALMALVTGTSQEMTISDSAAFLEALAAEGVTGPIGTVGYCMGGARALNAAATYPDRIMAGVDRSFPPEQSTRLEEALRNAEIDHAIENYVGMAHGWCVPDHGVYNEAGAERHWQRLITLFAETLI